TLPSQRYTLVMGTICAQAPSFASITLDASSRALSSLSVVVTTIACSAMRRAYRPVRSRSQADTTGALQGRRNRAISGEPTYSNGPLPQGRGPVLSQHQVSTVPRKGGNPL